MICPPDGSGPIRVARPTSALCKVDNNWGNVNSLVFGSAPELVLAKWRGKMVRFTATHTRAVLTVFGIAVVTAILTSGCSSAGLLVQSTHATVHPSPTPSGLLPGAGDTSANYVCGAYSAFLSVEDVGGSHYAKGEISAATYGSELEMISTAMRQIGTGEIGADAQNYLASAPKSALGWAYDPNAPAWAAQREELATKCAKAGSTLSTYADSSMGG
jgi:hypothetical protein